MVFPYKSPFSHGFPMFFPSKMVDLFNHQPPQRHRGDGPSDCRPGGQGLAGQRLEEVDRLPRGLRVKGL